MPCQPEQPLTLDSILVTYNTSPALADLFRDAKNNAYGIGCHDYPGARDRPCYVVSLAHAAISFAGDCQQNFPSTSRLIAICAASLIPFW